MNDLSTLGYKVIVKEEKSIADIMSAYNDDLFTDKGKINEYVFAKAFVDVNELRYHNGQYFVRGGIVTEEVLARDIYESITDLGIVVNTGTTVEKLLKAVKYASTVDEIKCDPNIIPFANGDLYLKEREIRIGSFSPTPYRLTAELHNDFDVLSKPNFDKWLHDLFTDDDIITIQEYLGYCLVPTTRCQKALFLVGQGGAGKSVLGIILSVILGNALISVPDTKSIQDDKFKLPELENKLVLYDDDLDNEALTGSGVIKKIITNELKITVDRKYGQPFEFQSYAKLVTCCNEMISSTDSTRGFYRRLLPILIKPIDKNFVPDLQFYDKIRAERDSIVIWALQGLNRLIANNWILHESSRSIAYLDSKSTLANHLPLFVDDLFYTGERYTDSKITSLDLSRQYKDWCRRNDLEPKSPKELQTWFSDYGEAHGITRCKNVKDASGKYVRGFSGLKLKSEATNLKVSLI